MLDPTVPEVRKKVVDDITRLRHWGYELIKHDYTTYDIFGRWGFQLDGAWCAVVSFGLVGRTPAPLIAQEPLAA